MLGEYIEKNILRSVYICEQGFTSKGGNINNLCDVLNVSKTTIRNDIKKLKEIIPRYLISYSINENMYYLYFKKNISLQNITKEIYNRSLFLKGLYYSLHNKFNVKEFSENEFISLSKAYKLKSFITHFFIENGFIKENKLNITEIDYRFIVLTISSYTTWLKIPEADNNLNKNFNYIISYIERNYFCRKYTVTSKRYILNAMHLSYLRQNKNTVTYQKNDQDEILINPLYLLIRRAVLTLKPYLLFKDSELLYIYSIINSQSYHSPNLVALNKDFKISSTYFINKRKDNLDLMDRLIKSLNIDDNHYTLFKKAFLGLVRPLSRNNKLIIPNQIYLLSCNQKKLYLKIREILYEWEQDWNNDIYWNKNNLKKFTIDISLLLQKEQHKPYILKIITNNNFNFLYYKSLSETLFDKHVIVDTVMYSDIYEILSESSNETIIICEKPVNANNILPNFFHISTESAIKVFLEIEKSFLLRKQVV